LGSETSTESMLVEEVADFVDEVVDIELSTHENVRTHGPAGATSREGRIHGGVLLAAGTATKVLKSMFARE